VKKARNVRLETLSYFTFSKMSPARFRTVFDEIPEMWLAVHEREKAVLPMPGIGAGEF